VSNLLGEAFQSLGAEMGEFASKIGRMKRAAIRNGKTAEKGAGLGNETW